jgi:hypothetical protein
MSSPDPTKIADSSSVSDAPSESQYAPNLELRILPYAVRCIETMLNGGLWAAIVDTLAISAPLTSAATGLAPSALDPMALDGVYRREMFGLMLSLSIQRLSGLRGAVFDVARTRVVVSGAAGADGSRPSSGRAPDSCCVIIPVSVPDMCLGLRFDYALGGSSPSSCAVEFNLHEVNFEARIHIPIVSACCGLSSALDMMQSTLTVGNVSRIGMVSRLEKKLCDIVASTTMFSSLWSGALYALCEQADDGLYAALSKTLEDLEPIPLCACSAIQVKPLEMGMLPAYSWRSWLVRSVLCLNTSTPLVTGIFHMALIALSSVAVYLANQCLGPMCVLWWIMVALFSATLSLASAVVRYMLYLSARNRAQPSSTIHVPESGYAP